jgi:general secretion pathway protein G
MQQHPPLRPFHGKLSRVGIRGFTMMELLVVLAILALLATLTISNVGGIFDSAKISTAQLFVKESMNTTLFNYKMHVGDYPSTSEGLQALVSAPAQKSDRWRGPYLKEGTKLPMLDPWGEPYQYRYPGQKVKSGYDLWSKGPDKIDGNEDDIGNWDTTAAQPK